MAHDQVEKMLIRQAEDLFARQKEEGADLAAIDTRLDALRTELAKHQEGKLEKAATIAGSFDNLEQVIYLAIQIKSSGEDVAKLDAQSIEKAAAGLKFALEPAKKALE